MERSPCEGLDSSSALTCTGCPARRLSWSCRAVRVLVSDGALEHVTGHLSATAIAALRTTCREMRWHAAIMSRVDCLCTEGFDWFDTTVDLPYLRRLPKLEKITIWHPDSCFCMHAFSQLQQLQHLELLEPVIPLDMRPLQDVRSLQTLYLYSCSKVHNLHRLTQLTAMYLDADASWPGLRKLESLRRLHAYHASHISQAAGLPHLSHVEFGDECDNPEVEEALQHMRHLPALRTLVVNQTPNSLTSVLRLTQLTALYMGHSREADLDLSALAGLRLLGISSQMSFALICPTCTCIRLELFTSGRTVLPSMVACGQLSRLEITAAYAVVVEVTAAMLPPQPVSSLADLHRGKLLAEVCAPGADERFQVQLRSG